MPRTGIFFVTTDQWDKYSIFLIGHLKSAPFLLTIRPQNPFPASRRPFGPAESEAICENRHRLPKPFRHTIFNKTSQGVVL